MRRLASPRRAAPVPAEPAARRLVRGRADDRRRRPRGGGAVAAATAFAAVTGAVSLSAAALVGPLVPAAPASVGSPASAAPPATDPTPHAPTTTVATGAPVDPAAGVSRYVVREGDTLTSAAVLHALAPADLAVANALGPPYRVVPGQALLVPARPDPGPLPEGVTGHPERGLLDAAFRSAAARRGVPAELLMAVGWQESRWRDGEVSGDGAVGMTQLMPATARWVADELLDGRRLDPRRTPDNLELSATYLRYLLDRSDGDEATALAGYYQGPSSTAGGRWYDDTERYVRDVFALRWGFEVEAERAEAAAGTGATP